MTKIGSHGLVTARRSCGKVMFSQAYVKNSVHMGHACHVPPATHGQHHPRPHSVMHTPLPHLPTAMHTSLLPCTPPATHAPHEYFEMRSMSRQYASYLNAFLFIFNLFISRFWRVKSLRPLFPAPSHPNRPPPTRNSCSVDIVTWINVHTKRHKNRKVHNLWHVREVPLVVQLPKLLVKFTTVTTVIILMVI